MDFEEFQEKFKLLKMQEVNEVNEARRKEITKKIKALEATFKQMRMNEVMGEKMTYQADTDIIPVEEIK